MSLAEPFLQSAFARFINSPAGRAARVVVGLGLIAWGYTNRGTGLGLTVMIVGLLPLATGALDLCILSAVLGGPLSGERCRSRS